MKIYFSLILALLFTQTVFAASIPLSPEAEDRFSKLENKQHLRCVYDATSDSTLRSLGSHYVPNCYLPKNAIVTDGAYHVKTTFTSATDAATISLNSEAVADLLASVAISNGGNPFDAGVHATVPVGTAATMVEIGTTSKQVQVGIEVEALTGGKLDLFLDYVIGE